MERCEICGIEGEQVRLFDAIYQGRMSMICERCSIIENIPIIKKPDSKQLRESERTTEVYTRMKRLSGMREDRGDDTFFPEDRLKELQKHPELEKPEQEKLNLQPHYHWEIMKQRRRKGLSQQKLAETLGESEVAIQMIEKGKLPENAETIIKKLEQYFQMRLRKQDFAENFRKNLAYSQPVLLDEYGKPLEVIPEPEIQRYEPEENFDDYGDVEEYKDASETPVNMIEEQESMQEEKRPAECRVEEFDHKKKMICETPHDEKKDVENGNEGPDEVEDFNIKKANLGSMTINDLRDLHRKKIIATRQEQIEEQRRIEERQKLIEARKEELRQRKLKESEELDKKLGGTELFRNSENGELF